jgi:hypothetical protein
MLFALFSFQVVGSDNLFGCREYGTSLSMAQANFLMTTWCFCQIGGCTYVVVVVVVESKIYTHALFGLEMSLVAHALCSGLQRCNGAGGMVAVLFLFSLGQLRSGAAAHCGASAQKEASGGYSCCG